MRRSMEVDTIVREARDMARASGHSLTTGHVLLGMLINPNRSRQLLEDLGIDAKRILKGMRDLKRASGGVTEAEGQMERALLRMEDAARHTNIPLAGSLHLVIGLIRDKESLACTLFRQMGIRVAEVRTMAIQRIEAPAPRNAAQRWSPRERTFTDEPLGAVAVTDGAAPEPEPQPQRTPPPQPQATARTAEAPFPPLEAEPVKAAAPAQLALADLDADVDITDPALYELDTEQFPLLTGLGRNLTADAAAGVIDPVIGRDEIIDAMLDVVNKRRMNNPLLVGEPGVGKTAVVEALANAMLTQSSRNPSLRNRIIISVDVGSLVAGTELRGSFSRRMARLKDEVRATEGQVIVFIDEIHTLVGAGSGDGALDAANDLKAVLSRGEFPCIGATTPSEYHRYIERDQALERRFQPLMVPEPTEDEALEILAGVAPHYEQHHGVIYLPEALESAVRMSGRYIVDRCLPDKALNLIDTAAARAVRQGKETVEANDVAEVVSDVASIPVERLMMSDAQRMLGIRDFLGQQIISQGDTLDTVSRVIQRNSAGFQSNRPIGSFLFLGPTGVGKTETAKALADFLFCSRDAITRFDMSEYMERHAVSRLLGAAPGYVGHEDAGALTAALARRPYQIILFDEIEKAHPDVLYILLQILDEGHVTDTKGKTLSFSNTVIVLTSNLGADALKHGSRKSIGFAGRETEETYTEDDLARLEDRAREGLAPELWGRIDEVCVFAPLTRSDVGDIARLLISESSTRLSSEREVTYEVEPDVVDWLIAHGGYEPTLGARPMRRAVQDHCETAVAQALLRGGPNPGDHLLLKVGEPDLVVENCGPKGSESTAEDDPEL